MKLILKAALAVFAMAASCTLATAQKYNVIDRSVAVIGNEMIPLSSLEDQVHYMMATGYSSDRNMRCELLEQMMESKLFLMQARLDSLSSNEDAVGAMLNDRIDRIRQQLGGDEAMEEYFHKPIYKLRQEWRKQLEDQSLTQQEQSQVVSKVPDLTPYDVRQFLDTTDVDDLPVIPIRYQLSQICIYPDKEAAKMAVKEKLIDIRERIINGEKFATLARIYSEDKGSAVRGGELGMAPRSLYWPAFSDAAMSLKPGVISQIVETPDGFHLIEVIEKKGDMFNARHILMTPQYTLEDRDKAFKILDSLKIQIEAEAISFKMAAAFYSQDPATRTNGGQMADPETGSSYFEIDNLKRDDYLAIKDLKEGEISAPIESTDNEGRNGQTVYKIIRVDKIIPAHPATFESDFDELQKIVKMNQQEAALDKFLDEKIAVTHIVIDPMFKDCEFKRSGWSAKFKEED